MTANGSRRGFVVGGLIGGLAGAFGLATGGRADAAVSASRTSVVPFGMYSMPPGKMTELAAAGFTWAGPFYPREMELTPSRIVAAKAAGLGVLHPVGLRRKGFDPLSEAGLQAAVDRVREDVLRLRGETGIRAWYLMPEELRSAIPSELVYLERAARAISETDPLGRPIVSYQPNARDAAGVREVGKHLDWVTQGTYVNYTKRRDERLWVRHNVEQIVAACGGSRLPICTLEMFQDPAAISAGTIRTWVLHDVFCALVSGAKAILVFSGWQRPNFSSYETYFSAYRDVAALLNAPAGVGRALVEGQPETAVPVRKGAATTTVNIGGVDFTRPSVSARRHRIGQETTVALVNSSAESVTCEVPVGERAVELLGRSVWERRTRTLELGPFGVAVVRELVAP